MDEIDIVYYLYLNSQTMHNYYKMKLIYQTLQQSLNLINSRHGRDKMCRFIQYFIKFALPTLESQGERYALFITKLKKLEANMSLTRKVLRFGK